MLNYDYVVVYDIMGDDNMVDYGVEERFMNCEDAKCFLEEVKTDEHCFNIQLFDMTCQYD